MEKLRIQQEQILGTLDTKIDAMMERQTQTACLTYKQGMKAIGFSLEDEDASEVDHEDFMRGKFAKFGPR